jgi:EpsD family peptidyl-prolyl cis-trans isomerase
MPTKYAKTLLLSLALAALLSACGDKTNGTAKDGKGVDEVAARVNGTALSTQLVNNALQRIPNLDTDQAKAASLRLVRNLVDQEVLAQKAISDKLDSDPVVAQALEAARRQVLAEAYLSRKLGPPVEPTEAEITDYFNKHPELFAKRKIYRLQEISIKVPQDKHEAVRARLAASKNLNEFGEWLKAENLPVKAVQGVKAAEQLPLALLPKLAEMPDGQAMVANIPNGLLVVVLAGSQAQPVTLDQARQAIARVLQNQARQKAAKAELEALKAAAKIEYLGEFSDAAKADASGEDAATAADDDAIGKAVTVPN